VPGQLIGGIGPQEASDGAMVARIARRRGDSAVGADFAWGNGKDHAAEGNVSLAIWAQGISQQVAFGLFADELIRWESL